MALSRNKSREKLTDIGIEPVVMKKNIYLIIAFVFAFALITSTAMAEKFRKDYFFKPQIGGWFGPVTPLGETDKLVDVNLSGGIFFRYNLPSSHVVFRYFKLGVDASYQRYRSRGLIDMHFAPLYGSLIGLLPVDIPIKIQLKFGAGAGYFYVRPDRLEQWDPIIVPGLELSFPAGRLVNIGLRLDYIYVDQSYVREGAEPGHFLNIGVTLYFNL